MHNQKNEDKAESEGECRKAMCEPRWEMQVRFRESPSLTDVLQLRQEQRWVRSDHWTLFGAEQNIINDLFFRKKTLLELNSRGVS